MIMEIWKHDLERKLAAIEMLLQTLVIEIGCETNSISILEPMMEDIHSIQIDFTKDDPC